MSTVINLKRLLSALVLAIFIVPASAFADAGKILFVLGQASIVDVNNVERPAQKGSVLQSGDKIVTTRSGQVQVRMSDGGLIAVRPGSEFVIENFKFEGKVDSDKSIYKLLKGGFRSVTGKVGEANKSAYKVNTPVATIGIRGTDYTARLCSGDCADTGDGLYVGVLSGGVVLQNDVGIVEIDPAEYGFVQDAVTLPALIDQAPNNVLFAKVETSPSTSGANNSNSTETSSVEISSNTVAAKSVESEQGQDLSNATDTVVSLKAAEDLLAGAVTDTTSPDPVVDATPEPDPVVEPTPPTYYRTIMTTRSDVTTTGVGVMQSDLIGKTATGELTGFTVNDGSVTDVTYVSDANIVHQEYRTSTSTTTGNSWGRWTNGTVTSDGTPVALDDSNSQHWIASADYENQVVMPMTGSATYKFEGGTLPTDNLGNTGTISGLSNIQADFGAGDVQVSMNVSTQYYAETMDWTASGTLPINGTGFSGDLSVTNSYNDPFTGGIEAGSETGRISGQFTAALDPNATLPGGIMTTYELSANSSLEPLTIQVNGVASFAIDPNTIQ